MLIYVFQGTDIKTLQLEVNALTSGVAALPDYVLQTQSSIPKTGVSPATSITTVTITVCYK